jgi:cytosine/adenosine deaminase-related metal-dependent hydrolase
MRRIKPDTARCLELLGQELWRNDDPSGLVRGHVCVFGSGSASDELTKAAVALAEKKKAAFTQHQNTRTSEVSAQQARLNGKYPLLHLAEIGALRPHCAFTHMNLIREEEMDAVREAGLSVIWCAAGSMNWSFGGTGHRRPHGEMFRDGINVAIASDIPKWGHDTAPMMAFLLSRDGGGDAMLSAEDIFEMTTLGSARAVGMETMIGSLEAGKKADIVIRTTEIPEYQPGYYPIQNLLMTSRGRSIDVVIVNGEVVIRGGHATRVDERAVGEGARLHATRLAEAVGIKPESAWPIQ